MLLILSNSCLLDHILSILSNKFDVDKYLHICFDVELMLGSNLKLGLVK